MTVIPVKERRAGADTVTVTRNEILTGINSSLRYSALEDEGVIIKKLIWVDWINYRQGLKNISWNER